MDKYPILWIILIIGGITLIYLLIRYVINRGVDKAADAIRNSRVRNKNEQAGSVYNAPVQRNVATTDSASAASSESNSSPVLRDGVEYLRDWYPNYKPAHIRHGLQGQTPTTEIPMVQAHDPVPVHSAPVSEQPVVSNSAPVEAEQPKPLNSTSVDATPIKSTPAAQPVASTRSDALKDAVKTPQHTAASKQPDEPLGGFLKAIVIIYYIAAAAMLVSGVLTLISLFSLISLLGRYGMSTGWLWFAVILLIVAYPITAWASFQLARRIKQRDPSFLWFFHRMGLIAVPLEVIVAIICCTNSYMQSTAGQIIVAIIEGLVGAILLTVYFVRSKRVHTYMGNDEYLYQSPFTRRYANFDRGVSSQPTPVKTSAYTHVSGYKLDDNVQAAEAVNSQGREQQQERTTTAPDGDRHAAEQIVYSSQPTRCCLCGDVLEKQYAVLFVSTDGSEMRVDRKCYEELRDLGTSEDVGKVRNARFHIFRKKLAIHDRELAAYLDRYLTSGDEYLNEKVS